MNALRNTLLAKMSLAFTLLAFLSGFVWAQADDTPKLPDALAEAENQQIRKEQSPKSHVEAVLRVADARLLQTLRPSQASDAEIALKQLELYGELLDYADDYTRRLPHTALKERNKILKMLEQAIFKQQRNLEGARQELPFEYREATDKLVAAIKRIRLRALNDVLGNGEIIK